MTEATAVELNFSTVAVPEKIVTRQAAPNPFIVNKLFPTEGKAIQLTLPANTDDDEKVIKTLITQARKAGNMVDKTARVKREDTETEEGTGKNKRTVKTAVLTFWTVDKITKPRQQVEQATVHLDTPEAQAS